MGALRFWISFAARSLRRDGQRSLLAAGCVAFGVLSLVGLQQLSAIVTDAFLVSPRVSVGGDLTLRRPGPITATELDALSSVGLERFTAVAGTRAIFLKPVESGRTTILSRAEGIDPTSYPLRGSFELRRAPSLAQALKEIGDAVITADLADRFDLAPGDRFQLFGAPDAPPFELEVVDVAERTPDRRSQGVWFSLDTARERGIGRVTHVLARHDDPAAMAARLESAGWTARVVEAEANGEAAELFRFMLAGAGILGLLLGGVGVANTMKVVLARRRQEIAALKALGYRRVHLLLLFGLETAMLGLVGSIVGIVVGLLLANLLMDLLSANMAFLLSYSVDPTIVLGALLVGVATTLIFGAVAIVQASSVRPSILLRDLPTAGRRSSRARAWSLYLLLAVLFGALSSVVLESVRWGVGVVALGVVGLGVLGLGLGGVLLLVVRVPTRPAPLLGMALRNLRHQPLRSIHGLVALFVGVIAIGMATVVLHDAELRFESRRLDLAGINLRVYGTTELRSDLEEAITELEIEAAHTDVRAEVVAHGAADTLLEGVTGLVGRPREDLRWNLTLVDSLDREPDHPAYLIESLASRHDLRPGDTLRVRGASGETTLELAGIFRRTGSSLDLAAPPPALITSLEHVARVDAGKLPLQVHLAAAEEHVAEVADALGEAVPAAVVIGKDAIGDAINRLFEGLFWFTVAVAALALVAGVVLIANAVGLSMLQRQRELGVLKALGYSSRQVLTTVVLENTVTGGLGGAMGVLALVVALPLINHAAPAAELSLPAEQAFLLVAVATVCSVGSALVVAWRPTRVRPLAVLRRI